MARIGSRSGGRRPAAAVVALSGLAAALSACAAPADLVLRGGRIVTLEDAYGDVTALAVRGDRIVYAGDAAGAARFVGAGTRVIELAGRLAIPGFIEGHGHFIGIGEAAQILDLDGAASFDEVVERVRLAAVERRPGEWILGRGWHQEMWNRVPEENVAGFPVHAALSAAAPDNPVCLTHKSGHACLFNAQAMALAGVDARTADPEGGTILRFANGAPSGVFIETAAGLVTRMHQQELARRSRAQMEEDLRRAAHLADVECLAKGITSFQDAGSSFMTIDVLRSMARDAELGVRLYVMIREPYERLAAHLDAYRLEGEGGGRLTVRAIKKTLDGALGSRGAWLLEPYTDAPGNLGLATTPVEELARTAELAARHGFQLCVHAIGDRANRETLDVFERVIRARLGPADHRFRVEHAQHLHPDDVPRFARLGVIAAMQGVHCTSDGPWVEARIGAARARDGAYVWRKLIDSGALVINGTDAPVEDVSPLQSYHAAVTRRLADGTLFHPEQRMTRREALESYTLNAARAAFEEEIKGSLRPGKLADITVLSRDILEIPAEEIPGVEVDFTIVGGRVLHARAGADAASERR